MTVGSLPALALALALALAACRPATDDLEAATPDPVHGHSSLADEGAAELDPDPTENPSDDPTRGSSPGPLTPAPVDDPGRPDIDETPLLDAPSRYEHLVLRAGLPVAARYRDLVYEGNNKSFRGPLQGGQGEEPGLYRAGEEAALDWRRWAAGVSGLVVLRDSLFSQQDHPVLQSPRALMMPPSWVSVAVAETMAGASLRAPIAPALEDDAAWAAPDSPAAMFGSFPPSERLFTEARLALDSDTGSGGSDSGPGSGQAQRTRNARRSIQMLAAPAQAMIDAAPGGAEQVAATGAEWIAASDRTYFGASLRETTVIPIFVENPNKHESRDEGKGMGVWGRDLPEAALNMARDAVYARRLLDGALAVERYDLREHGERARATHLLEALVPAGSSGHPLWLWVNGGSDGHGKGEPAYPYLAEFRAALEAADIEMSRVRLLSKPSVRPRGDRAQAELDAVADLTRALGVPASVQLSTRSARRLLH